MFKYSFLLIILTELAYCNETNDIKQFNINDWFTILLLIVTMVTLYSNYNLRKKIDKKSLKNSNQEKLLSQNNEHVKVENLIANIAHQWRDALAIISSINVEIQTKLNYNIPISKENIKECSNDIEKAVNFMSDTMKVFLEFYKNDSIIEVVNIKDSIEKMIDIIDMNIKKNNISINIIEISPLEISTKKSQWMNIWFSLISNSLNASSKAGMHSVNIEIIIDKEQIIYKDNCQGINKEVLKKIENNMQKGLGLKIVKDILLKNKWNISYSSTKEGIEFILYKMEIQ